MLKQKKSFSLILLLSICSLLLVQEIAVSQVMCYKTNGTWDVELALFSFQCQCNDQCQHTHLSALDNGPLKQLSAQCFGCYDLLFEDSWLTQNNTHINPILNLFKLYDLDDILDVQLNNPHLQISEAVPKSKFLSDTLISPTLSVVLRC